MRAYTIKGFVNDLKKDTMEVKTLTVGISNDDIGRTISIADDKGVGIQYVIPFEPIAGALEKREK